MPMDTEVHSPEWWLKKLYAEIQGRRNKLNKLARYYDGEHDLAFASEKFLEAFGGLFDAFADNWCALVVDAVEQRLNIEGFRVGGAGAGADADAWRIWQANQLDAQSQLAHTEALLSGASYVTVWYGDEEGMPEITVEHPAMAIVDLDPRRPRHRRAALRCYVDDWGYERAELFLPDGIYAFRSRSTRTDYYSPAMSSTWEPDRSAELAAAGADENGFIPNPLGVVPMVELTNRPRLKPSRRLGILARSEIAQVIPIQDSVNKMIADMIVSSEAAAYPQRYATGFEIERDPETGAAEMPFKATQRVWWMENPDGKFGAFPTVDVSNYVKAIEMMVNHIAAITETPPHYLNASADRLSGESIKAAESGLVAKVRRKQRHFGEAWEEVMRLSGKIANLPQLEAVDSEVIWGDPESRTESQFMDSLVKKMALGVPRRQLWEDARYSPTQIARFQGWAAEDALMARLAQPNIADLLPRPAPMTEEE